MTEEQEKEVLSFIDKQVEKLHNKNYMEILDEFETLKVKFMNSLKITEKEKKDFLILCKYLMVNGHSNSLKLSCEVLYQNYLKILEEGMKT